MLGWSVGLTVIDCPPARAFQIVELAAAQRPQETAKPDEP